MSAYDGTDGLEVEVAEGVLRLRINRPAKRNALDDSMVAALIAALDAGGQDEAVRVVLLSAYGDHFCSGFDVVGRNQGRRDAPRPRVGGIQRRLPSQAHRLIPVMLAVQTPIVCAVRGWAAGIGLHMVLAADFAVVSDDARLWEPFMARGFTPDSGGTWLLPRRIGEVRAKELLLLGRELSGAEAATWGMVHRAVPDHQLDTVVAQLVEQLGNGPTVSLGLAKWLLGRSGSDLAAHLADEAFALELSSRTEDFREGMSAFSEKRSPQFKGR